MSTINLQIEPKSFEQSKSQTITGIIFFDFGNYQFPETGWNDFAVIILSWWLSALKNIILGETDNEELRFMDGPLYITVNKLDRDHCNIECFNERAGGVSEFSEEYSITELVSTILSAAKTVETISTKKKWDNENTRNLKSIIKELEEL